jgi:hypothetical protein
MNERERFSFRPERPGTEPTVSEEGIVSGELGHVETPESEDPAIAMLRSVEAEARKDAMLSEIFDTCVDDDPSVRAALIVERINAFRRELAKAKMDPDGKRDRWLSDIANRLRGLI